MIRRLLHLLGVVAAMASAMGQTVVIDGEVSPAGAYPKRWGVAASNAAVAAQAAVAATGSASVAFIQAISNGLDSSLRAYADGATNALGDAAWFSHTNFANMSASGTSIFKAGDPLTFGTRGFSIDGDTFAPRVALHWEGYENFAAHSWLMAETAWGSGDHTLYYVTQDEGGMGASVTNVVALSSGAVDVATNWLGSAGLGSLAYSNSVRLTNVADAAFLLPMSGFVTSTVSSLGNRVILSAATNPAEFVVYCTASNKASVIRLYNSDWQEFIMGAYALAAPGGGYDFGRSSAGQMQIRWSGTNQLAVGTTTRSSVALGVDDLERLRIDYDGAYAAGNVAVYPLRKTVISITFDDGEYAISDYRTLLESNGVRGTVYLVANTATSSPATWISMASNGWEIGSHSFNHPDFSTSTVAATYADIIASKTALNSVGLYPTNFAYPFGNTSTAATSCVYSNFRSARVVGDGFIPGPVLVDRMTNYTAYGAGSMTLAQMTNALAAANDDYAWIIFYYHASTPSALTTLQQFIAAAQAEGYAIKTVNEALDYYAGKMLTVSTNGLGTDANMTVAGALSVTGRISAANLGEISASNSSSYVKSNGGRATNVTATGTFSGDGSAVTNVPVWIGAYSGDGGGAHIATGATATAVSWPSANYRRLGPFCVKVAGQTNATFTAADFGTLVASVRLYDNLAGATGTTMPLGALAGGEARMGSSGYCYYSAIIATQVVLDASTTSYSTNSPTQLIFSILNVDAGTVSNLRFSVSGRLSP